MSSHHEYYVCVLDRMDDRLIEVVGMYSSLHIGTIQVSLSEPLRIGQASEVKVILFVIIHCVKIICIYTIHLC